MKKKQPRYNTEFLPHYVYKIHKQWYLDGGFVDFKDRVITNENK